MLEYIFLKKLYNNVCNHFVAEETTAALLCDVCFSAPPCWNVLLASRYLDRVS